MKLKLTQQHDVSILNVYEDVDPHNAKVLRAGITKLFKSGKNKIILNILEAQRLSHEILREIIKLHLIATELKGCVVIVGQSEGLKQAILSFSDPPALKYFHDLDAGVKSFFQVLGSQSNASKNTQEIVEDLKKKLTILQSENESLKTKIKELDLNEIRSLRTENSLIQKQLIFLNEQIRLYGKDRKKPIELPSVSQKIFQLDVALEGFLTQEGLLSK